MSGLLEAVDAVCRHDLAGDSPVSGARKRPPTYGFRSGDASVATRGESPNLLKVYLVMMVVIRLLPSARDARSSAFALGLTSDRTGPADDPSLKWSAPMNIMPV